MVIVIDIRKIELVRGAGSPRPYNSFIGHGIKGGKFKCCIKRLNHMKQ